MFFVLFCIFEAFSKSCSNYDGDYYKLVAQLNEKSILDSAEIFNDNYDYANYLLTDQDNKLQLQKPIHSLESRIIDDSLQQPEVLKISTIQDKIGWTNYFALFRIAENNYEILYTSASSLGGQDRLPKFDSMVQVDSIENIKCQDFVIYQKNQFIVDCYELKGENPKHFFYYITINADTKEIVKTKIDNNYPFQTDYHRQLQLSSTADKYYLHRITSNKLNFDNTIEIFTLNLKENQVTLFTEINKQFFIDHNFTTEYPQYKNFIILNVKSDYFSLQIAITDAFGNLIFQKYFEEEEFWSFSIAYHEQGIVLDSFDCNFDSGDFVVQAKNKLLFTNQLGQIQMIDFKYDISSYKPQYTKSFIVLKNENNLILIYSTIILYTLPGQYSVDLFDYFQNDFLIVENNKINRYYVENDLKIIFHPNDQSDQKTHQAQIQYKDCIVQLEYQAIVSTYSQLIQVRKGNNMFAEEGFISLPTTQWTVFNEYVSGPLKQKSFLNTDLTKNEELIFSQDGEVDLSTFPDTANVQFLKVIYQQNSQTQFVLLTRYSPNILLLKVCSVTHYLECKKQYSYTLDTVFTNKNIELEYKDSLFTMFILRGNNQIWTVEIDVNTGDQKQKLNSLSLEMETIGLTKEYIIFWSSQQSLIIVQSRDTLNEKYRIKTDPQQIFCNQNSNTIYIYSKDKKILYLITLLSTSVITQYKINFSQETADIKILFHYNTFSLIQKFNDGKINAQIWSNELETHIYILRQLPLYNYEIYDLSDVTCSQTDEILYIKTKSNLLVYFVDQPNHNSLHNVLEIKENLMYMDGVYGLLFGVVEEKLTLYSVNYLNYAKYQFGLVQQDFVEKKDYIISYTNKESRINLQQNLKIFNSNTKIILKPENLQIQTNLTQSNQKNFAQDMGTDWYQGMVIDIKPVGNNGVNILQQVNLEQEKFIQNVDDVEDFNDEALLAIFYNTYSLVSKKDGSVINKFQFQNSYQCYDILHIQQKKLAIVYCIKGSQILLVSIVCQGSECQSSQGLPLQSNVLKVFIFSNQMFLVYENQLNAYNIKDDLLQINQAQSQGSLLISVSSYGNEMNQVRDNHYHRYYLDKSGNFLIDEINISDNKIQKFNTITFDLFNFLNIDYQMNSKNSMRKILILSSKYDETDLALVVDLIFLQYTGSHYGLKFTFQCKTDTCLISKWEYNYILQGYPTFNLFYRFRYKIPTKNNYLIIPYQEEQNKKNFIAVYKLAIPQQQSVPILFNGIVRLTDYYPIYLVMKLAIYENQNYLLLNVLKYLTLAKFSINDSPKIVFDGKFNSTNNVTIQVQNDFESTNFSVSIIVTEDDSGSGSLVWLWVTLGIVGGCVIFGAGFYFYKKKKSSVQDQLIA